MTIANMAALLYKTFVAIGSLWGGGAATKTSFVKYEDKFKRYLKIKKVIKNN